MIDFTKTNYTKFTRTELKEIFTALRLNNFNLFKSHTIHLFKQYEAEILNLYAFYPAFNNNLKYLNCLIKVLLDDSDIHCNCGKLKLIRNSYLLSTCGTSSCIQSFKQSKSGVLSSPSTIPRAISLKELKEEFDSILLLNTQILNSSYHNFIAQHSDLVFALQQHYSNMELTKQSIRYFLAACRTGLTKLQLNCDCSKLKKEKHLKLLPTCGSKECYVAHRSKSKIQSTNQLIQQTINNFDVNINSSINESKADLKCKVCNSTFKMWLRNGYWSKIDTDECCPYCYPKFEQELYLYENYKELNCIRNSYPFGLKHGQLDLYFPEQQLAIEFNGLFWHQESKVGKNYHRDKQLRFLEQGIQVVNIFEQQFNSQAQRDLWVSIINNKLKLSTTKLYARKLEIGKVPDTESKKFLELNHIQGNCHASINLGLYYNKELQCLMTFAKPRFDKKYQYEMLRFCTRLNTNIVGGASKLLTAFEREFKPTNLVSYANKQFSNGNLYKQLGFELLGELAPGYWWSNGNYGKTTYSRYQTQKHKLVKLLGDRFNPNMTEEQNMISSGFYRIFDCGNLKFVKMYK